MAQLEGLKEIEFGPLVPSGAFNIKNQSDYGQITCTPKSLMIAQIFFLKMRCHRVAPKGGFMWTMVLVFFENNSLQSNLGCCECN